jgi:FtsH-binding integral membrane protein
MNVAGSIKKHRRQQKQSHRRIFVGWLNMLGIGLTIAAVLCYVALVLMQALGHLLRK